MNITEEQNGVKTSKRQLKKIKRRRATSCKLIRPSNSNPGYFKYEVTIQEKNGSRHTEPCYGIDMQDAISRLIWKERTIKIESKLNAGWIFAIWLCLMSWPAFILSEFEQPIIIVYMFAGVATVVTGGVLWYNYINKD
mgnify:CR=1 FL=1